MVSHGVVWHNRNNKRGTIEVLGFENLPMKKGRSSRVAPVFVKTTIQRPGFIDIGSRINALLSLRVASPRKKSRLLAAGGEAEGSRRSFSFFLSSTRRG
jgi:hypothetical protein